MAKGPAMPVIVLSEYLIVTVTWRPAAHEVGAGVVDGMVWNAMVTSELLSFGLSVSALFVVAVRASVELFAMAMTRTPSRAAFVSVI
jgi:hypothetical protein